MPEPVINLDAARAARREVSKQSPKIVFGKKTFTLPAELPFSAIEHLSGMDTENPAASTAVISAFVKELFGEQYADFNALQPSANDIQVLMEELSTVYGFQSVGE